MLFNFPEHLSTKKTLNYYSETILIYEGIIFIIILFVIMLMPIYLVLHLMVRYLKDTGCFVKRDILNEFPNDFLFFFQMTYHSRLAIGAFLVLGSLYGCFGKSIFLV